MTSNNVSSNSFQGALSHQVIQKNTHSNTLISHDEKRNEEKKCHSVINSIYQLNDPQVESYPVLAINSLEYYTFTNRQISEEVCVLIRDGLTTRVLKLGYQLLKGAVDWNFDHSNPTKKILVRLDEPFGINQRTMDFLNSFFYDFQMEIRGMFPLDSTRIQHLANQLPNCNISKIVEIHISLFKNNQAAENDIIDAEVLIPFHVQTVAVRQEEIVKLDIIFIAGDQKFCTNEASITKDSDIFKIHIDANAKVHEGIKSVFISNVEPEIFGLFLKMIRYHKISFRELKMVNPDWKKTLVTLIGYGKRFMGALHPEILSWLEGLLEIS